jgi:hypothetical protein
VISSPLPFTFSEAPLNHDATDSPFKPGEFPFPLTGGRSESPFLTWLRNHSNYMTARGLFDYFRLFAVLVRGILINGLVLLPALLMIALALSLVYGGLLNHWDGTGPIPVWVKWTQAHLRSTPPFLLTPLVSALAAGWVLLFPILLMLTRIAGHKRSLVTGSDSSVTWRDRYERSFGAALLLVVAVALFELLPLFVHYYHQLRVRLGGNGGHWKEFFAGVAAVVGALSGAPRLLARLEGVWQKLAMAVIALVGLLVPLIGMVLVIDFLVYVSVPARNFDLLIYLFLVTPAVYSALILVVILVGFIGRTFSGHEYRRLFELLVGMIAAHLVLFAAICGVYVAVFGLVQARPDIVPQILLAVDDPLNRGDLTLYGDLAAYVVLGCALEIWLFCWLTVDINLTSIHGLYRDRLASAYLLGLNTRGQVDIEQDIELGELCCHATGSTAPYPLINVALNLQGSKDVNLRDRQSDFFIFSKKFIGSARTGYCRSATMEQAFPQIDLATAMAISAAAASPNMGRGTSPALVMFMTLLNVRLGVWVPNPGLLEEALSGRKTKRRNIADLNGRKPGFAFEEVFLDELVSMEHRWEQLGPEAAARRLAASIAPTPAHGLAGIAFSGGGIRSATINLGIVQALHRAGIFEHFDYMSTVSGGGYLGSSISTLMRYKTPPVSEIAGTATVDTTGSGEKVVTVAPGPGLHGEARTYRYSKDARVRVKTGDVVKPGTWLIHRADSEVRSEIAGTVGVEATERGGRIVRISGRQPGETRQYLCTRYDELNVAPGQPVKAGDLLVKEQNSFGNRFRWRVRPGALLREMTMRLDEIHPWVNLSDGGHIENLAAIELLRRRCKLIVIGDGECDQDHHFGGLATLMRTARLDLGIHIDIGLDDLRLDANRQCKAHVAIGRITYPGESEYGYLLYLKSSCTGDEDDVIGEYRRRNARFPHESTADQFFDEGQFESYRALGQHIGENAIEVLAPVNPSGGKVTFTELARCFEAAWERTDNKETRSWAKHART